MAPSATADEAMLNTERNGMALEETSDNIDTVNVLRAKLQIEEATSTQEEKDIYEQSKLDAEKDKTQFRKYEEACDRVKDFYRLQHEKQTVVYNLKARSDFKSKIRAAMRIWEAMEKLNTLIDGSDPDTSLSQIEHLLQSAEAIRRDGKPRWFQLIGQWDVVGDTFPVGCALTKASSTQTLSPRTQITVMKYTEPSTVSTAQAASTLPDEALAMIRYHSFYPPHSAGAYKDFMNEYDEKMLEAVRAFNPYDLYSKTDDVPKIEELEPYYLELIDEFFPQKVLKW
ncbi:MAG: hypothetical protein M1830_008592 [Pleopsidium flavum]|nr:MAG: hypothetical protein M1830_008592 [Pleopsidium flavum]